jgi:hypothetical protein
MVSASERGREPQRWGPLVAAGVLLGASFACTEPNPDYDPDAAAALCTGGQRRCGATGTPQVCARQADNRYAWTDDFCPQGGGCDAGRCTPPAGAAACSRDADCGAELCVVFASGTGLGRFCAPATGTQAGGAPCAGAPDCRSGLCQKQVSGPPLCYTACAGPEDCAAGHECLATDVTITGVRGQAEGCMVP